MQKQKNELCPGREKTWGKHSRDHGKALRHKAHKLFFSFPPPFLKKWIWISDNIIVAEPEETLHCFTLRFKVVGLIYDFKGLFETEHLKGTEDEVSYHLIM